MELKDYYPGDEVKLRGGLVATMPCGGCRLFMIFQIKQGEIIPSAIDCSCGYRTETVSFFAPPELNRHLQDEKCR